MWSATSRRPLDSSPSSSSDLPEYLLADRVGELQEPAARRPDGHPEQVQGDDRARRLRRDEVPLLRDTPHGGFVSCSARPTRRSRRRRPSRRTRWAGARTSRRWRSDYDEFAAEFDRIAAHVREQMSAVAPAERSPPAGSYPSAGAVPVIRALDLSKSSSTFSSSASASGGVRSALGVLHDLQRHARPADQRRQLRPVAVTVKTFSRVRSMCMGAILGVYGRRFVELRRNGGLGG